MAIRPSEPLIYDRTLSDVTSRRAKGNYNVSDFKRIQDWQIYIKEKLNEMGYYVPALWIHEEWDIDYLPRLSEINKIKNNLQILKDSFYDIPNTPEVPSQSRNAINFGEANDIEKIMVDMDLLIQKIELAYRYADFLFAGEDIGLPNTINEEE